VWFFELAPVGEPAFVPQAIANVLAIPDERRRALVETLEQWLGSRRCLLVVEKIGIHATIEQLEAAQAGTLFTQAKFPAIFNHTYAYGDQDPDMQFTAFAFRPEGNASRLKSPEYTRLVDAARREPDFTRRMAIYGDVSRLVKEEAFLLPIANTIYQWGVRANIQGIVRQPLQGFPRLEEVWLS
jgi:ABC-type transport system substrate-binding protein